MNKQPQSINPLKDLKAGLRMLSKAISSVRLKLPTSQHQWNEWTAKAEKGDKHAKAMIKQHVVLPKFE